MGLNIPHKKLSDTFLIKYHLHPPRFSSRLQVQARIYMMRLDNDLPDALEDHMFEYNDEKTWNLIVRDSEWAIKTLNGLIEIEGGSLVGFLPRYKVICDWTNNTAKSISKCVVNIDVHLKFDGSMVDCDFQ